MPFLEKKIETGRLEGLEASVSLLSSAPENAVVIPLCPTTEKRKRKRSKGAEKSEAFVSLQSRQWSRSFLFFLFLDLDLKQQLALSLFLRSSVTHHQPTNHSLPFSQALRLRPRHPSDPGRTGPEAQQDQPARGPPELPGEGKERRKEEGRRRFFFLRSMPSLVLFSALLLHLYAALSFSRSLDPQLR